jgi:hypothetical protein
MGPSARLGITFCSKTQPPYVLLPGFIVQQNNIKKRGQLSTSSHPGYTWRFYHQKAVHSAVSSWCNKSATKWRWKKLKWKRDNIGLKGSRMRQHRPTGRLSNFKTLRGITRESRYISYITFQQRDANISPAMIRFTKHMRDSWTH